MFDLFPFAAHNLARRNRLRTLLTISAIATSTLVFSAVMVVPFAINGIVEGAGGSPRLAVTNRASILSGLPESYYRKIERIPGVVAVSRMTWFGGIYDDPKHQFPSMGVDADNPDQVWPEYALNGELMAKFKRTKSGAVVGVATLERFRWKIGDLVSLRSPVFQLTLVFKIVGTITQGPGSSE